MSIRLIQDLHAGISRRDWHAVETAANRLRDDVEKTVAILAGTGVGSLPNDYPLSKLALDALTPAPSTNVVGSCPTCEGTGKEGRHSICRDCDEAQPPTKLAGWKLVPTEPTDFMIASAIGCDWRRGDETIRNIWCAMLKDAPPPQPKLVGLMERLTASLATFTKHYDPQWMEPPRWATEDDSGCSTFSKRTFGELRRAAKLVEEARAALASEGAE